MPVYGNGWEAVKQFVAGLRDRIVSWFTSDPSEDT